MGGGVTRGEVRLAQVGRKRRPVLVLTRPEVIGFRERVTVAEISTSIRGHAAEVRINEAEVGLDRPSVVNCDGLHTVAQSSLGSHVGDVDEETMRAVCWAVSYGLGC